MIYRIRCRQCGAEATAQRAHTVYCSGACRSRAHRERVEADLRELAALRAELAAAR